MPIEIREPPSFVSFIMLIEEISNQSPRGVSVSSQVKTGRALGGTKVGVIGDDNTYSFMRR